MQPNTCKNGEFKILQVYESHEDTNYDAIIYSAYIYFSKNFSGQHTSEKYTITIRPARQSLKHANWRWVKQL